MCHNQAQEKNQQQQYLSISLRAFQGPFMHSRLTVFNQKGGVGKTTTALNLGAALARRGLSPVLVDLDAQAHLTSILSSVASGADSLFAYYQDARPLASLSRRVNVGGREVDLLPAHTELSKVDTLFGKGPGVLNRLKAGLDAAYALPGHSPRPLLIDCSPMLGVLSLSGVLASERVLVPISTDFLAMRGALQLESTLQALEHVLKQRVQRRYLLTRFDARRRMSHEIAGQARAGEGALRGGVVRDAHRGKRVGGGKPGAQQGCFQPCAGQPRCA
jgi:chromosome partitioning protein